MVNDPRLNVPLPGIGPAEPGYFGLKTPEQPTPAEPQMPAQPTDLTTAETVPVSTSQSIELPTDSPSTLGAPSIPTESTVDPVALTIVDSPVLENPENFKPSQLEAALGLDYPKAA